MNKNNHKAKNYRIILYLTVIILNIIFILLLLNNLRLKRQFLHSRPLRSVEKSVRVPSKILKYGDRIGNFQVKDILGKSHQFDFTNNEVILIQFFDVEIGNFAKEILSYENLLWKKYGNQNFSVLGVCRGNATATRKLIANENLSFPVVADTNFVLHKLFGVADNEHAMFLLTKTGLVSYSCTCGLDKDNLRQLVENHVLGAAKVIPEKIDVTKELADYLAEMDLININNQRRHNIREFAGTPVILTVIGISCNSKNIEKRVEFLKQLKNELKIDTVTVICVVTNPTYQSYLPGFLEKSRLPIFFTKHFNIDSYWTRKRHPNPFTLLLNRQGQVVFVEKAETSDQSLQSELKAALKNL